MGKKIIIAGGGTGGHIFPAIAIANAMKKMDRTLDILFVGANGKMEMEKIPQAGYPIKGIDIAGYNRSSMLKNFTLPFKLIRSFTQVRRIFGEFKPNAAIGVGGYSSFPVLRYAQAKNIPTFIHESNSFAGKSNILLAKKANKIFVAASGMEKFFPKEKIQLSGNPVRATIRKTIQREEGIAFFGLNPSDTTVLATGGSLGAKSINEAIHNSIGAFQEHNLQLIWQTGKPFLPKAKEAAEAWKNIWANDFIDQMEYAFAAADIVISRAGAMAIAELCVVGKPVIFVPYPHAAEDHQTVNAQHLVYKNAGILIKDAEAVEVLVPEIINLAENKKKQEELIRNISSLAIADADEVIARTILQSIDK
ncbi:MAG TPA: undecaprenyldiphospho-muramoylpentapeptide beta-N-acetylglucosaminyltransferase [Flavitalea sp.]|nr:undecaprenyldiphospho-muramoylpentapeptide beta-N-acetylglucosaminyltransferase [Flavitalea sp.]